MLFLKILSIDPKRMGSEYINSRATASLIGTWNQAKTASKRSNFRHAWDASFKFSEMHLNPKAKCHARGHGIQNRRAFRLYNSHGICAKTQLSKISYMPCLSKRLICSLRLHFWKTSVSITSIAMPKNHRRHIPDDSVPSLICTACAKS
jgi:hypothetical protein